MLIAPPSAAGAVAPLGGGVSATGPATGFEALLAALFAPVSPGAAALVGAPTTAAEDASAVEATEAGALAEGVLIPFGQLFVGQTPLSAPTATSDPTPTPDQFATASLQTNPPIAPALTSVVASVVEADIETLITTTQATPPPPAPDPPGEPPVVANLPTQPAAGAAASVLEAARHAASSADPPAPAARPGATRWSGKEAAGPPGVWAAKSTAPAAPPPTPSPAPGLLVAAQAQSGEAGLAEVGAQNVGEAPQPQPSAGPPGAATQLSTGAAAPAQPARVGLETIATLAAQILKKLDERSTRFDMALEPAGLGRVDVRLEVGAHGRITAAMAFDNPHAAAEMKNRAGELTRALELAGFDVSGGLSFDLAGDQGQAGGKGAAQDQQGSRLAGRAFQAALDGVIDPDQALNGSHQARWSGDASIDITV